MPKTFDKDFFFEHTWSKFAPRRNLEFLLHGKDTFLDEKEMITRALSTWLISGRRLKLTKNAIGLQLIATIGKAEQEAIAKNTYNEILTDFVARVNILGQEFFGSVYYPIGGMKVLSRVGSIKKHR